MPPQKNSRRQFPPLSDELGKSGPAPEMGRRSSACSHPIHEITTAISVEGGETQPKLREYPALCSPTSALLAFGGRFAPWRPYAKGLLRSEGGYPSRSRRSSDSRFPSSLPRPARGHTCDVLGWVRARNAWGALTESRLSRLPRMALSLAALYVHY